MLNLVLGTRISERKNGYILRKEKRTERRKSIEDTEDALESPVFS
jgi:hypothetical protein